MIAESKRSYWTAIKNTVSECRKIFKEGGFKAVINRYGWKIFAVFFVYYLIRDLTLYVLIPYLVAKHFMN